ncbi:MAG: NADH-quinone oxidoreductase subunit G, partial [Ralstonia sp.]
SNVTTAQTAAPAAVAAGIERLADVPIYHADPIVRRAGSLQLTATARAAVRAGLPADLFAQLGLANGDAVRVTMQGQGSVVLPAVLDRSLAAGVIRVPAATEASAQLGAMFGAVNVEKVESSALAATV